MNMFKKIIITTIIFLSTNTFTNAQNQNYYSITGIVRDSADNKVLPNATLNINYGQKLMLSDDNGKFKFTTRGGELILVIKYVNYLPYRLRVDVKENLDLNVFIKEISSNLEQVTISGQSADNNVKRPLMGVATMNIKELKKIPTVLGEIDVFRGLQMLPGVTSVGEASNGVNVRGGTTDQNLMLLDEAPIFNPTHMFGLFSVFPSEAIANFDLYKGNVPAKFGGRTAAVLDVKLANPSLTKKKAEFAIGLVSYKALIDIPIIKDKLGVMVTGRVALNDFLLTKVSSRLDDIMAKFADGTLKVFYKINNKNTLSLTKYYSYDFAQTNILGSINSINSTNTQYDYRSNNFSGKWLKVLNDKLNIQTIFVVSKYAPQTILPELNSNNKVKLYQDIDFKQLRTNLNYNKGNHIIEVGMDGALYTINPGELLPGTSTSINSFKSSIEKGVELGIYIEDELKLTEKLTISAGLRYSSYASLGANTYRIYGEGEEKLFQNVVDSVRFGAGEIVKTYGGFEPRLGINYAINEESSIKLGFNTMRQYLQVVSNTTTPIPTSRWKNSDYHVKPQISILYSLGYFKNINDNIFEISTEAYYKTTNNILDYKPGASFLLQNNIETELLQGINKSYGLEFMISKKKGELTGWVNYTFARSLNKVNEGPSNTQQINYGNWYATNYDRPHTFNAAVVIAQTKMHDFSFNFTYSTGRPFTAPKAFIESNGIIYPFYTERNNSRIPDYHRLDFSWNIYNPKNLKKKYKGNWNFTVYNLYSRKNAYSLFIRNEDRVAKPYKLVIFGAPILSLAYNFKIE
jgi:TonB dependent receptor/CarboxypepD_reg-like domain/TonB-dependent Receptor Plug Domain